jgi:hypothetical protein
LSGLERSWAVLGGRCHASFVVQTERERSDPDCCLLCGDSTTETSTTTWRPVIGVGECLSLGHCICTCEPDAMDIPLKLHDANVCVRGAHGPCQGGRGMWQSRRRRSTAEHRSDTVHVNPGCPQQLITPITGGHVRSRSIGFDRRVIRVIASHRAVIHRQGLI